MLRGLVVLLAPAIFVATVLADDQPRQKGSAGDEQSHFSEELLVAPIQKPSKLPEGLLQQLRTDSIAVKASKPCPKQNGSSDEIDASWFQTSEIHLDGPDEIDLIVLPRNQCLNGVNVGPFWIARKLDNEYRLILSTGGHDLEILNTRYRGYRDVRVSTATATMITTIDYRFNGLQYQKHDTTTKPIE